MSWFDFFSTATGPLSDNADLEAMGSTKEGRVLSAKNYELITNAIDALTVLRDAADKSPPGDGQPKAETWLESLYKALLSK